METNNIPESRSMKIPIKSTPIWLSLFKSSCSIVIMKNDEKSNLWRYLKNAFGLGRIFWQFQILMCLKPANPKETEKMASVMKKVDVVLLKVINDNVRFKIYFGWTNNKSRSVDNPRRLVEVA